MIFRNGDERGIDEGPLVEVISQHVVKAWLGASYVATTRVAMPVGAGPRRCGAVPRLCGSHGCTHSAITQRRINVSFVSSD